ncbi:Lipocalin-like domain-containing protein [Pseudomassariella vexata]|uniref:Lipocalin-like domain-containing protein n=1 Tax=Pseudomassariella vexata TaxID=1141098 RepID=A0A1Y2DHH5_9PEZI|nr:Lipocalin-like domain-containing protein [Pseudomassariella vexata]ORY58698.1 Lipocalin-like domain-containing protein [Pseudomassariella vexata]
MVASGDILDTIVGIWQLVNTTNFESNGTSINTEPQAGILTYHKYGYMSANTMSTVPEFRPEGLTWPPQDNQTDLDWATVARHTLGYSGPFSINQSTANTGFITHGPLYVADIPSWVGTEQLRPYTLTKGKEETILRFTLINDENGRESNLYWKKLS